jgi:hypothetical protein
VPGSVPMRRNAAKNDCQPSLDHPPSLRSQIAMATIVPGCIGINRDR